ncbi:MAG: hypothetical protein PHD33_00405 [Atribacterota bacterium]|nr:hypothetical protein [Atribacterota bacterium]
MRKKFYLIQIMLFCIFLVVFTVNSFANNVNFVIKQMEESYSKQMSGIDDMTIVQGMDAGFFNVKAITYQKKDIVNNNEIFKYRTETEVMDMNSVTIYDGLYTWSNDPLSGEVEQKEGGIDPLQVWKIFDPDKMQYLGEEKVNDKDAYVVQLDGAIWMMGQEEIASQNMSEEAEEMEMQSIYWIDKSQFIPLKSRNIMKTTTIEDGETVIVNTVSDVQFLDYRLAGSMLIPYKVVISTEMEIDDPTMSEEEKKMAQSMMSSMGMGEMEMTVQSVEINKGLSDDLFDGTKLEPTEGMLKQMPGTEEGQKSSTGVLDEIESMSEEDISQMLEGFMDMIKDFAPKE